MMQSSFKNGVSAGLLVALALGVYLVQLWAPARQVELHSLHLADALEDHDWAQLDEFVDQEYEDQWGHERPLLLARLRQMLSSTRNFRVLINESRARAADDGQEGDWRARVTVDADPGELTDLFKERVNGLEEPFDLRWRKKSWKPWDWKLVRVTNHSLELPSDIP